MALKMQEILTSEFYVALADAFNDAGYTDIYAMMGTYEGAIQQYALLMYTDLLAMDMLEPLTDEERANIAYVCMGESFARIFTLLMKEYDPFENYFTDRTMDDDASGNTTRTGGYSDTPSGTKRRNYTEAGTMGQGTTFDNASDWRNISKTTQGGNVDDTFINYSETRAYNNMKDTASSNRDIEEHRKGNSGIFAKQDLASREIQLRLKNRIVPIFVRMVIDVLNKGVWLDGD